ncbi:VanZ family protein [Lactobacillus sp. CC-MHH1034]|uniref:VanZ family protein n=1 Tax=Agrilactobacillus fermenti TaxID=2586909 RepID=UPI001E3541B8|nr:VanZ family protein [Agrilactobacillus fermenti]MCD2255598.1 VanZ family protein [Agrilactobacillus fermenti]
MTAYLYPIKMAILIFPFLALLISLPIFAYEYHRRGSFVRFRAFVIYTFIFYLLTAYFLIILPLPSRALVAQLTTPKYNLQPLMFVQEFIKTNTFDPLNIHTYRTGLLEPAIIQPLFNIFLTIPFGIYLKYFGFNWRKILIFSFVLSLFFELTQLSGLYGIYVRPYRLFDVDDLLLNTSGGMLGWAIAPIVLHLFPDHEAIQAQEKRLGQTVTFPRRFVAFLLDWLIFFVAMPIVLVLVDFFPHFVSPQNDIILVPALLLIVLFFIVPVLMQGATLGKRIVHLRIVRQDGTPAHAANLFWRAFWQYFIPIPIFTTLGIAMLMILEHGTISQSDLDRLLLLFGLGALFAVILLIHFLVNLIRKNPDFYYDNIAHTTLISTFKSAK